MTDEHRPLAARQNELRTMTSPRLTERDVALAEVAALAGGAPYP